MTERSPNTALDSPFRRLVRRLFEPIDIASLVYFRVVFGAIMLWEVWRYLSNGAIKRNYIVPEFHFTYHGFDWVQPWPGDGMYYHFYALGILAIFIAIGFLYRLSATLFCLGFTYVFLLDQARYLNHFYLVCLVSFLMIFVPAHHANSVDAHQRKSLRSETVPAWPLWLLRAQMGIVYFFGGLAKLNWDWLQGMPLTEWLGDHTDFPIIGHLFDERWMGLLFSYGGLLLDLLAVPFLLWRRTRMIAFLALLGFHLLNAELFSIGIFPLFAIGITLLYFPPDWPRRVFNWPRSSLEKALPVTRGSRLKPAQRLTTALLGAYIAIQILVPLRHWLYPGNVSWTEEGHNFSWHMKLRDKKPSIRFQITDPKTPATWTPELHEYLTSMQIRKMGTRPDMILLTAHHLAERAREDGHGDVEVRVQARASLNGRLPQLIIDPNVDLAAQTRTAFAHSPWILPLQDDPVKTASDGSSDSYSDP